MVRIFYFNNYFIVDNLPENIIANKDLCDRLGAGKSFRQRKYKKVRKLGVKMRD